MTIIREFQDNDYPEVLSLWNSCQIVVRKSDEFQELKKILVLNPDIFLVVVESQKIIGSVIGTWDGRRGWINHLAVSAEKRNLGIGTALLKEVENRLASKGCTKINLTILPNNQEVITFYKAEGYLEEQVVFMSKKIVI